MSYPIIYDGTKIKSCFFLRISSLLENISLYVSNEMCSQIRKTDRQQQNCIFPHWYFQILGNSRYSRIHIQSNDFFSGEWKKDFPFTKKFIHLLISFVRRICLTSVTRVSHLRKYVPQNSGTKGFIYSVAFFMTVRGKRKCYSGE